MLSRKASQVSSTRSQQRTSKASCQSFSEVPISSEVVVSTAALSCEPKRSPYPSPPSLLLSPPLSTPSFPWSESCSSLAWFRSFDVLLSVTTRPSATLQPCFLPILSTRELFTRYWRSKFLFCFSKSPRMTASRSQLVSCARSAPFFPKKLPRPTTAFLTASVPYYTKGKSASVCST